MDKQSPWTEEFDGGSSESDVETKSLETLNIGHTDASTKLELPAPLSPKALLIRRAETYQEYMNLLPLPKDRGSVIPFRSWMQLGKSLKDLYGQPLHYLTNILLNQWDKVRIESGDECTALDNIIHPLKAEAAIWTIEEVHRRTASPHAVAKHWLSDPMYYAFIDSEIPDI